MFTAEKLFQKYCVQYGIKDDDPRRDDVLNSFCVGFNLGRGGKLKESDQGICEDYPKNTRLFTCRCGEVQAIHKAEDASTHVCDKCQGISCYDKGFCEDCQKRVFLEVYNRDPKTEICSECGQFDIKPF
jgi:hypothetical protein